MNQNLPQVMFLPITRENFRAVTQLSVAPEQKGLVSENAFSLAQAYAQPECVPLAVSAQGELVGFVMYALDHAEGQYWIYRLMIDGRYQKKGYGRAALCAMIERIFKDPAVLWVYISFKPENSRARALYESVGFVSDGRVVGRHNEPVYKLCRERYFGPQG